MEAVILTMSGKHENLCVAVYSEEQNRLYRLVSDSSGGAIPFSYFNSFSVMDIVQFKPIAFIQNGPQKENIQIDMNVGITKIGHYRYGISNIYQNLYGVRENNGFIFGNSYSTLKYVDRLRHSLEICKVSNLAIKKVMNSKGKETGKADFYCGGYHHENYSVTDFDHDIRKKIIDTWIIGDAYIVVSIPPEPYEGDGKYYKFISSIFEC